MKINIQTIKNAKHSLEVGESDSVLAVKQRIADELKLGEVGEQKLIYLGKILANEQTLADAKIKANDTLVIMISKVKKTPAPTASSSSSSSTPAPTASVSTPVTSTPAAAASTPVAATPTPATTATSAAAAATPTPIATPAAAAAAAAPVSASSAASSSVAMGSAYEDSLLSLMSLGFERQQAVDAMRAAYNNADRAAEYLFGPENVLRQALAQANQVGGAGAGGIGAQGGAPQAQAQAPARSTFTTTTITPPAAAAPLAVGAGAGAVAGGASAADILASSGIDQAQIQQLRTLLQSNPSLAPLLIQQIAQSSPEIMAQVGNNPAALEQMLAGIAGGAGAGAGAGLASAGGAGGARQPRGRSIHVTEEEKTQLDNLEALGFNRDIALEAWLICDRNFEMAANYLFEHGGEIAMDDVHGGDGGEDDNGEDDDDMHGHHHHGGGGGGDDDDEDLDDNAPYYE